MFLQSNRYLARARFACEARGGSHVWLNLLDVKNMLCEAEQKQKDTRGEILTAAVERDVSYDSEDARDENQREVRGSPRALRVGRPWKGRFNREDRKRRRGGKKSRRAVSTSFTGARRIRTYLGIPERPRETPRYPRPGAAHLLSAVAGPSGPNGNLEKKKKKGRLRDAAEPLI